MANDAPCCGLSNSTLIPGPAPPRTGLGLALQQVWERGRSMGARQACRGTAVRSWTTSKAALRVTQAAEYAGLATGLAGAVQGRQDL